MTGFAIRPVEERDMDAVAALYAESVRANPRGFIQDLDYHGDIRELARRLPKDGGCFCVATLDGEVAGMGAVRPSPGKPGHAELCKLHLRADLQGHGHGKALARHLMAEMKALGFTGAELHVTTSQQAAIGLYGKLGFGADRKDMWRGEVKGEAVAFETLFMSKAL